jgi:hypothetical protein
VAHALGPVCPRPLRRRRRRRRRRGRSTLVSFIRQRDDVVVLLLPPVLGGQARRPRAGPAARWLWELGRLLGDGVLRGRRRRRGGFGVDGVWWFLGSRVVTPEDGGRRSQRVGTAAKGAAEPLHHDGAARRRQTRRGRAVFVFCFDNACRVWQQRFVRTVIMCYASEHSREGMYHRSVIANLSKRERETEKEQEGEHQERGEGMV